MAQCKHFHSKRKEESHRKEGWEQDKIETQGKQVPKLCVQHVGATEVKMCSPKGLSSPSPLA